MLSEQIERVIGGTRHLLYQTKGQGRVHCGGVDLAWEVPVSRSLRTYSVCAACVHPRVHHIGHELS